MRDGDGDTPDWIELHNSGDSAVNVAGWHLTDDVTLLTKWTFPSVTIPPRGYLLVFASGKDRAVAGSELHANFQLQNSGEYLALVQPNGTVAHQFAPSFPPQHANVSYGPEAGIVTPLLARGALAKLLVPSDGSLGSSWTAAAFNDSTWLSANTGIGFTTVTSIGAVVLSVDFNRRASDPATSSPPGWSPFMMDGTGVILPPTVRTFGSITVTVSNTAGFGYGDALRAGPVNNGAFTDSLLLRDFIYSRNQTNIGGLDVTVEGLTPNAPYTVSLWSFDSGSPGNRVSDWYANGALVRENYLMNGQVPPTNNAHYRITFEAASDAFGRILVSGRRDPTSVNLTGQPDYGVFLNALQVTELNYGALVQGDVGAVMRGQNASAYIRLPFNVSEPAAIHQLRLRMKYNDGFAAYLNGQPLAAANTPANLSWDATAAAAHGSNAGLISETFIIDATSALVSGGNVLAIHGLNVTAADDDFLILPELDGLTLYGYFASPTPGGANGSGAIGVVADTKFSADRGFYDVPFTVALATDTPGAQIWYTRNGSRPSPTNGTLYVSPVLITNTTFLRAAAYKSRYLPSDVDTHTYIFLDSVLRQSGTQPGYPTNWQANYPADYGMDSNIVNHPVYGTTIKNDLRAIPTLSIVSDHTGLWSSASGIYPNSTSTGPAWEREASAELISGAGSTEFATRCGIEMHGNASRDNVRTPKHSMRLSFKNEYGPTKLRHDWFGGGVDVHDAIVLRSCGFVDGWAGRYADTGLYTSTETGETFRGLRYRPENTCYLRDVWVKESFRDMGWSASRSTYVHLYINGLYWGLYQPSERLNASYFSELYGGHEGAWDVIVGEDNNGPPVVVDGAVNDWQTVLNIVNAGITNEAAYQAVAERIDIDNLIDYMMLHIFAESEDWPRHNWYVAHRRATNGVSGTKFICSVWDQELTLDRLVRRNRIAVGDAAGEIYGPGRVYSQLRTWPEFRRQFGDRVQKHLFNGGALTPSNNIARLLAPAAVIRDALVGESARWGDARKEPLPPNTGQVGTGKTFTRDEWWQPEIDKLVTNFFPKLTSDNIARFRGGNLYPALSAPTFSHAGGSVSPGFALTMSHANPSGTIFFTTDGSDPRAYGTGQIAPTARAYGDPVLFNRPTLVRARVINGSAWSALMEAAYYPPQDFSRLALTEIMYNPPPVGQTIGEEFEFVELKNTGTNLLDLSGLLFNGINFTFPYGSLPLAPGEFCVLVRNPSAFSTNYPGVTFRGTYVGRLDNGGEPLRLTTPDGGIIFSVTYDDEAPWPVAADAHGYSIVPRHSGLTQAPDNGANWRASAMPGGSPGADDPEPMVPAIWINEVLSASVPPDFDSIEMYNPNVFPVDVSGWFLTDNPADPRKFRIPDGTVMAQGAYLAFDESSFNPMPGIDPSFALSSFGEQVYLFSADTNGNLTGFTHGFSFGPAEAGVSFGRYVNSAGVEQFPPQSARTFLSGNSGPRIGPVVINEIHYHPATGTDEFVELYNRTATNVILSDWRLDGAGFIFPEPTSIAAFGYIVVTSSDPTTFRLTQAVPNETPVYGPYTGVLQDSGERLKLERIGPPDDTGIATYISVDEVRYNDRVPWPPAPDGSGPSLARRVAGEYGDDPINWMPAVPSPGRPNLADTDGDGLPDDWELRYGVTESDGDADGDGISNLQEYLAGTIPTDGGSFLAFERVTLSSLAVALEFTAMSNRTYSVVFKTDLGAPEWLKLRDVPVAATERWIQVLDTSVTNQTRFYRLVTPAIP